MKILVWGRGIKFSLLKDRFIDMNKVIGFVDNNCMDTEYLGKQVYSPDKIINMEYDALIIANPNTEAIYEQCIELGINLNKIVFLFRNWRLIPFADNMELMKDYSNSALQYSKTLKQSQRRKPFWSLPLLTAENIKFFRSFRVP